MISSGYVDGNDAYGLVLLRSMRASVAYLGYLE